MNTQTVKPELNNPEMKARFVAQYYGQMILFASKIQHPHGIFCKPEDAKNYPECFVLLTPLDQISDEHLMSIAKILGSDFKIDGWIYSVSITLQSIKEGLIEALNSGTISLPVHAIDFLRYNGYAVDWNGHKVEELISAGYCQLRKGGGDE